MRTITRTHLFDAPAPAAAVFPLLCPVLEYRWIPHWRCEVLHSKSGVAEDDCVFRTDFPDTGPMTWVVTRYEPPACIEFCCFAPDLLVMRLKIVVSDAPGGAHLKWTRSWLSLGPRGDAWIDAWSDGEYEAKMATMRERLTHYLETGVMAPA